MMGSTQAVALVAFGCVVSAAYIPQRTMRTLPPRLDTYISRTVKLTTDERRHLADGAPVTRLIETSGANEIGVFGAVWINAPARRYVDLVNDIEHFERGGGFRVTRRIHMPPRLEDFADLRLSNDDIDDLRACRVGDCQVKLGEQAIRKFRTEIDWRASNARGAANTLMRQILFDYVRSYVEAGNERLPIYRDKPRPTDVASEFRAMTDAMPELTTDMPDLRRHLLEYPTATLPDSTSFLYWQETEFGLKPTIRISHLTIREGAEDTIVASKMLYASHYFCAGVELRVLLPDPSRGSGFWFVMVNRGRSDGLTGLTGALIGRRVRSEVQSSVLAALRITRQTLERTSS